ncbi:AAA family ATPase [Dysgonomonas sp. HDW5B]|uniref:AAA family ATPase n=1 Tax=Dysgonomonas sp. HDW5B TaxID=2714927 RepID=UPI00140AC0F5|nr:AAA family ATPase [Dysgonomonas sp. HDW5B]QIK54464.1 AAA family ATPase [Dysgonomonas sp. HDW5B]
MANITFDIECNNLAPIKNLKKQVKPPNLKIGIYANNGSGKTFISRMFRMLEGNEYFPTDDLISFGSSKCNLKTIIKDTNGNEVENFNLEIKKGVVPTIPNTNYIYHTFNSDYIEENVQNISFEKDGETISGYILGKEFIDISEEETKLKILEEEETNLTKRIEESINRSVEDKLNFLPNLKRVTEYQSITFDNIIKLDSDTYETDRDYETALSQYNSVKSMPADLEDLVSVETLDFNFNDIISRLKQPFDLSEIAQEFKVKVQGKQKFVEDGLSLITEKAKICPFCEQDFSIQALKLIDQYNSYLKDTEAKTIKILQNDYSYIENLQKKISSIENQTNKISMKFNEYTEKYILSMINKKLILKISDISKSIDLCLEDLKKIILKKIKNINTELYFSAITDLEEDLQKLSLIIRNNNILIEELNSKKLNIKNENLEARKVICRIVYNGIKEANKENIHALKVTRKNIGLKKEEIAKMQERSRLDKKKLIASTTKLVLNSVFKEKYSFDEETFKLSVKSIELRKDKLKNVLSEGEKSVLAFAYYLGDTHHKIKSVSDYNKLFFIIDDPISSLDFNYVYSICGVLRDLKKVFEEISHEKFLIFTHNTEFMRILGANNMLSKKMILKNGELKDYNTNFSVPYISHLLDIYNISNEKINPNHTTANSIRHILETIVRFENCSSDPSTKEYIERHFDKEKTVYTLINDLSHGALRYDQPAITDDQFIEICTEVVSVIEKQYPGQIEFVKKI